jgi:hypothetical protein
MATHKATLKGGSTLPPHRRLDDHGMLEYTCYYCGKSYARFEQPVFLANNETAHSGCMPHKALKDNS